MKNIIALLFSFLAICACTQAQTKVTAPLVTNSPLDTTYGTHIDTLGYGGTMVLVDIANRDNIPLALRKRGMLAISDTITYQLLGGITNEFWVRRYFNTSQGGAEVIDSTAYHTMGQAPDSSYATWNDLLGRADTLEIWVSASGVPALTTANNGLTAVSNNIQLGGALIQPTTVDLNSFTLDIPGNSGHSVVFAPTTTTFVHQTGFSGSNPTTVFYQTTDQIVLQSTTINARDSIDYYARSTFVSLATDNRKAFMASMWPTSNDPDSTAPAILPNNTTYVSVSQEGAGNTGEIKLYGKTLAIDGDAITVNTGRFPSGTNYVLTDVAGDGNLTLAPSLSSGTLQQAIDAGNILTKNDTILSGGHDFLFYNSPINVFQTWQVKDYWQNYIRTPIDSFYGWHDQGTLSVEPLTLGISSFGDTGSAYINVFTNPDAGSKYIRLEAVKTRAGGHTTDFYQTPDYFRFFSRVQSGISTYDTTNTTIYFDRIDTLADAPTMAYVVGPSGELAQYAYGGGGGGSITASNGLTKVVDDIQLGGTATSNIAIDLGTNDFTVASSGASLVIDNSNGRATLQSVAGKIVEVNDDNDRVLMSYDGDKRLIINSTGPVLSFDNDHKIEVNSVGTTITGQVDINGVTYVHNVLYAYVPPDGAATVAAANDLGAAYLNVEATTGRATFLLENSATGASSTVAEDSVTAARVFQFPNASGMFALTSQLTAGTVTNVAALTIGTSGTNITSSVANGSTTPVITLNVPTASATNRGALSTTDWSAFNAKQAALSGTGLVSFSGTTPAYNTTSASISNIISDETGGGGVMMFNTSPAVTTSLTTGSTTFALVNTTATTVNFAGAATTLNIGAASANVNFGNGAIISGGTAANNDISIVGTTNGTKTTSYVILQGSGGSVAIGQGAADASSILDIASTSQGVLAPRMTNAQMQAISSPASGLLVTNTDSAYALFVYGGAGPGWYSLARTGGGGGGGATASNGLTAIANDVQLYGTLTRNDTIEANGNRLHIQNLGDDFLVVDPGNYATTIQGTNAAGVNYSYVKASGNGGTNAVFFELKTVQAGNTVTIVGDPNGNRIDYTALTHFFAGEVRGDGPITGNSVTDNGIYMGVSNTAGFASLDVAATTGLPSLLMGTNTILATVQTSLLTSSHTYQLPDNAGVLFAASNSETVGNAEIVAGTVTVNTPYAHAGSRIVVTVADPVSGTRGMLSVPVANIVDGVSFDIVSTSATEDSTVNWVLINTP